MVLQPGCGMVKAVVVGTIEAPQVVVVLYSDCGVVKAADLGLTEATAAVGHVVLVLLCLH